ncbi:uncharacterized protein [Brachyistius frenatus]|uniref:uncharacterized protein n=1 Tax=Brachyistius frenatus TaxID=100188 RepID=UPI0037E9BEEF
MEVTIDEDECNSVKNTEAEGADDSSDEDVYVPLIPQRSTTSELFLECEEEELQPWQKQTSKLQVKAEDDVGEFTNDQTDYKLEPSPLQGNAANTSPPQVKTETPEPVDLSNQDFIVVSPQLTSRTEFTGSLSLQCLAGNSFSVVPAQRHLFQNEAAMMSEDYNVVHTSEEYQICNNPMSLSSVLSPAVYTTSSNQLLSDQCKSQTRSVPCSMPCFTVLKVDSTKKQ